MRVVDLSSVMFFIVQFYSILLFVVLLGSFYFVAIPLRLGRSSFC